MSVARAVSLVPSITETLLAAGVRPLAVTRFCPSSGSVPTVGGTKNPDLDAIAALRPDVVLMDREENRAEDAAALESAGIAVVATDVCSLDDVAPACAALEEAVGADLGVEALEIGPPTGGWKVFVPIWRRPWMTVNRQTYGSSLLEAAGLVNVFADSDQPYPTIDLDLAAGRRPDFTLAPSEPYAFKEKHRAELEAVAPVRFVDGQDLFWWGWRSASAVVRFRQMAAALPGA